MPEKYLSATDVAKMVGIHRVTVWRMVKDGRLPKPLDVLGLKRWREIDIIKLTEMHEQC